MKPRGYGHLPSPTPSMSQRGLFNKTHLLSSRFLDSHPVRLAPLESSVRRWVGAASKGNRSGGHGALVLCSEQCSPKTPSTLLSPSALRSSAALALGLARQRAPVPEHRLPVLGLCLRPPWMQLSFPFSLSLLFLLVRVALKLRSLRFHSPRLCRVAVFLIHAASGVGFFKQNAMPYKPTSLS